MDVLLDPTALFEKARSVIVQVQTKSNGAVQIQDEIIGLIQSAEIPKQPESFGDARSRADALLQRLNKQLRVLQNVKKEITALNAEMTDRTALITEELDEAIAAHKSQK